MSVRRLPLRMMIMAAAVASVAVVPASTVAARPTHESSSTAFPAMSESMGEVGVWAQDPRTFAVVGGTLVLVSLTVILVSVTAPLTLLRQRKWGPLTSPPHLWAVTKVGSAP